MKKNRFLATILACALLWQVPSATVYGEETAVPTEAAGQVTEELPAGGTEEVVQEESVIPEIPETPEIPEVPEVQEPEYTDNVGGTDVSVSESVVESGSVIIEEVPEPEVTVSQSADADAADDEDKTEETPESVVMTDMTAGSGTSDHTWGADLMNLSAQKATAEAINCSRSVVVAVIDSGVDLNKYPQLADRIDPNSMSFIEGSSYTEDSSGHGTQVAGIIAENTPSNVKLLILKVLDGKNNGTADSVAQAIEYATRYGADIINLSLGFSALSFSDNMAAYEEYARTIRPMLNAATASAAVITSAGNEGRDIGEIQAFPACEPNVITVSALSGSGDTLGFYPMSNSGSAVDFCAPGEDIDIFSSNHYLTGTSMASAFVSAAYALVLLSDYRISPTSVTGWLKENGQVENMGNATYFGAGYPKLDLDFVEDNRPERPAPPRILKRNDGFFAQWTPAEGEEFEVYSSWEPDSGFSMVYQGSGNICKLPLGDSTLGRYCYIKAKDVTSYKNPESEVCGYSAEQYNSYSNLDFDFDVGNNKLMEPGKVQPFRLRATLQSNDLNDIKVTDALFVYNGNDGWEIYDPLETEDTLIDELTPELEQLKTIVETASFTSSNEEVATVDKYGVVTAISPGTASIRVTATSSAGTAEGTYVECRVVVVSEEASKCGDNVYWEIQDDGIIHIFGEGAMFDYELVDAPDVSDVSTRGKVSNAPWLSLDNITGVLIDKGITRVGNYSFCDIGLVPIKGMEGVLEIGRGAITGPSEFDFPENVVKIEDDNYITVNGNDHTLPAGTIAIGNSFTFALGKDGYSVDPDNPVYCSEDGVLFSKDKTKLIAFPQDREGEYTIPDSVTEISPQAFKFSSLSKLIIGTGITAIPDYFLTDASYITEVILPEGIKSIGNHAFEQIYSLEKVTLPDSLEHIGNYAFTNSYNLNNVLLPDGLKTIGEYAFYGTGITSFTIPGNVKTIEGNTISNYSFDPFQTLEFMEGVEVIKESAVGTSPQTMYLPKTIKTIEKTFNHAGTIQDVYYPWFKSSYDQIAIDSHNTELKTAELHFEAEGKIDGTNIKWAATGGPNDLTLRITGTGAMPDYSMYDKAPWCEGRNEITKVIIDDGITHVGGWSLAMMNRLKSVEIPASVTSYGENVFRGDPELEVIVDNPSADKPNLDVVVQYLTAVANGTTYTPKLDILNTENNALTEGKDYEVEYTNTTEPGQGAINIHFKGDYADYQTFTIPFAVIDKLINGENIKAISAVYFVPTDEFPYRFGAVIHPEPVVKSGRFTLTKSEYTLSYRSNRDGNVGHYSVTAKGNGVYRSDIGKTAYYDVVPLNLASYAGSAALSQTSFTYDGGEQRPAVNIPGLTNGTDYSVQYENAVGPGTATATVVGGPTGNFTGSFSLNYTIIRSTPTPTPRPTVKPTATPTPRPTIRPTATPTPRPTTRPTATPTPRPTTRPGSTTGNTSSSQRATTVGQTDDDSDTSAARTPLATPTPKPESALKKLGGAFGQVLQKGIAQGDKAIVAPYTLDKEKQAKAAAEKKSNPVSIDPKLKNTPAGGVGKAVQSGAEENLQESSSTAVAGTASSRGQTGSTGNRKSGASAVGSADATKDPGKTGNHSADNTASAADTSETSTTAEAVSSSSASAESAASSAAEASSSVSSSSKDADKDKETDKSSSEEEAASSSSSTSEEAKGDDDNEGAASSESSSSVNELEIQGDRGRKTHLPLVLAGLAGAAAVAGAGWYIFAVRRRDDDDDEDEDEEE